MSDGARTRDHQDHNLVLYQLSYAHHNMPFKKAHITTRLAGFEPAAYGLEVRCSVQLSYRR